MQKKLEGKNKFMAELKPELTLAIQKPNDSPRQNLGDESAALLKAGGILFSFRNRVDDAPTNIPGLSVVRMKNADLAEAVAEGEVDLGIIGLDIYTEHPGATILKPLGFSCCTLKLGVKKDFNFRDPSDIANLRIATSYPYITARFFHDWQTPVDIREYRGGEEGVVKRGKADACVVISDSGDTLEANKLKAVWDIFESQATLMASPFLPEKRGSERIIWEALRRIMTGLWKTQYTMLEANFLSPLSDDVLATLPSAKSPTVLSLQSGGQATRSLVPVSKLKDSLGQLYAAGASEVVALEVRSVYPNLDDPEVTRMMKVIYGQDWQLDLRFPI